jgi:protease-4
MQDSDDRSTAWERDLLRKLATESLVERRRARRWGVFFKLLALAYLVALLVLWKADGLLDTGLGQGEHTAVVKVEGVIGPGQRASADNIIKGLRDAFEDKSTKGVILRINSPGGSPVQSGYVNDEIRRLKEKYEDIPVYAVATDICASGAYYMAVAADKIYVDKASLVGSIGVVINGFGFTETLDKLGVERRLLTAGKNKGMFDPFSPLREGHVEHLQRVIDEMHAQFIEQVKAGRGERLAQADDLFSGLFWSGERAVELGLADGLGSSSYVARELVGAEKLVDFTYKGDLIDRLAERLGAGAGAAVSEMVRTGAGPSLM